HLVCQHGHVGILLCRQIHRGSTGIVCCNNLRLLVRRPGCFHQRRILGMFVRWEGGFNGSLCRTSINNMRQSGNSV
ncbi:hypothetical protein MCOR33_003338, partial [Pyricularia grisea]